MDQFTSPILLIINTSIDKEIFRESWKVVGVCPIPKIDNPITVKDFWPISILSVLSKIYKKVILSQLLNYIERCPVYNPTKSGFGKGHSRTLLLKFRDDIQKAFNRNEITVLIDYSKAFDNINHKTLLEKLVSLNFNNRTIKIIISYLTNRWSDLPKSSVHFGVSQGSILGPILFSTNVAKLPSYIDSDSIQSADDTIIYRTCRPSDILQKISILENDIKTVLEWSATNGLVFNNDKLKYIISSSKKKINDKSHLIRPNRKSTAEETTVTLLGINFNQNSRGTVM